ncbi:hypothetical protein [Helicobacter bizzozeronii]|uniref:hypothetical protein n=1 Tax=Helicobacter bizzozeronii TaxID=56877 RepID=UPI000CF1B521|nr:hypothetical protein [Helicobacter bizzozeronii]
MLKNAAFWLLGAGLLVAEPNHDLKFDVFYRPVGGKMMEGMIKRTYMRITSLNNEAVLIEDIIINRGNSCNITKKIGDNFKDKFKKQPLFNYRLKYSQESAYELKCAPSQFLEIKIVTDKGDFERKVQ